MDGLSKNDIIRINVGGKLYMTTFHSICRYRNSYLYELICEKLKESNGDNLQNREIFIDRNGKRFEYILDFLRDGVLICKNDINLLAKILIEAIYFKIVALIKILKKKIHLLYSKIDSSVNRKILKSIFSAIEKEKITDNETRKQFFNESNILTNPLAEYEKLKALKLKRKKKRYTNIMEIHNVKNKMGINEEDSITDGSKNIRIKKKEREELDSSHSEKIYRSDEDFIRSSDLNESEKETHSRKNEKSLKKKKKCDSGNESSSNNSRDVKKNSIENNSNSSRCSTNSGTKLKIINEKAVVTLKKCNNPLFCNLDDSENGDNDSYLINIMKETCNGGGFMNVNSTATNNTIHNCSNITATNDINSNDYISDNRKCNRNVTMRNESLFLSPNREHFKNREVKSVSFSKNDNIHFYNIHESGYHSDQLEEMIQMHDLEFDKAHLNVTTQINNLNDQKKRSCVVPTGNIIVYDDVNDIEETVPPPMVSNVNLGEQIFSTTVDF